MLLYRRAVGLKGLQHFNTDRLGAGKEREREREGEGEGEGEGEKEFDVPMEVKHDEPLT